MGLIDLEAVKRNADLLALAERDTVLRRSASTRGGEWKGPCPICGNKGGSDQDGFSVLPNASPWPLWLCRTCTGGKYCTVIDYIALRDHLNPRDRQELEQICRKAVGESDLPSEQRTTISRSSTVAPAASAPEDEWQTQARSFIEICERQLWAPAGQRALAYLRDIRCLKEKTIQRFRLGYNAKDIWMDAAKWGNPGGSTKEVWLPRGIVIPCIVRGLVWCIKLRRPKGEEPKYLQVRGSRPALFNAEDLIGSELALITEGEVDAMTCWQELGDFLACITFGSSTNLPDLAVFGPFLRQAKTFLVAYDNDNAGRDGEAKVNELIRRVRVCPLPEGMKDINRMHAAGADLYAWIKPFLPDL